MFFIKIGVSNNPITGDEPNHMLFRSLINPLNSAALNIPATKKVVIAYINNSDMIFILLIPTQIDLSETLCNCIATTNLSRLSPDNEKS
jgi:hypothetical protein